MKKQKNTLMKNMSIAFSKAGAWLIAIKIASFFKDWELSKYLIEVYMKKNNKSIFHNSIMRTYAIALERNKKFSCMVNLVYENKSLYSDPLLRARALYFEGNKEKSLTLYKNLFASDKINNFSKFDLMRLTELNSIQNGHINTYDLINSNIKKICNAKINPYPIIANLIKAIKIGNKGLQILYGFPAEYTKFGKLSIDAALSQLRAINKKQNKNQITKTINELIIFNFFYEMPLEEINSNSISNNIYIILNEAQQENNIYLKQLLHSLFSHRFLNIKINFEKELISLAYSSISNINDHLTCLNIERILSLMGFLEIAFIFRKKSYTLGLSYFQKEPNINYTDASQALAICIETNNKEEAKKVLEKIKYSNLTNLNKKRFEIFYHVFFGEIEKAGKLFINNCNDAEKKMYSIVKNKQLAIIGPAPSDKIDNEINSYDFLVRTKQINRYDKKTGFRTDISSFNVNDIRYTKDISKMLSESEIPIILYKKTPYTPLERRNHLCVERSILINQAKLEGLINHVPDLIVYLLLNQPSKLLVSNINFFMDKSPYEKSYRKQPSLHQLIINGDNLIAGFSYTKTLYENNKILVSNEVKQILSLKPNDYVKNLERIYSKKISHVESQTREQYENNSFCSFKN